MAADNGFKSTIDSLLSGMNGFISTRTVVGEPVKVGDVTLIPLVDVTFGIGAGAFEGDKKDKAAGGVGGKVSPSAILVIGPKGTHLVNVKNQDALTKILDLVPTLADRFTEKDEIPREERAE